MRPILRREGALRSSSCQEVPANQACNDQELSFGLIFTIGSWANQGGRLFVGIILDRMGPRRTSFACALVCSVGSVIFGLASTTPTFAVGFFCIGVGGAGMQLSLQSASALFPKHRGLVMAMLSGAFQAASSVFLLMETLHRFSDVALRTLMLVYSAALLIAAMICLIIWPMKPFGAKPSKVQAENGHEASSVSAVVAQTQVVKPKKDVPLNERSFREQLMSPEYVLMIVFFAFTVLQAQFTIGTIGMQFELMGDEGNLTRTFNLIFSLSWTITPLVGHMLDRFGFSCMLFLMNTVMLCSCACLLVDLRGLQYLTAVLYTVGRVSIWAAFFSFNGQVFGFKHYGKLAGGGLFIASCFSLIQYPLLALTLGPFKDDFRYVNTLFIILCVAMYPVLARLSCLLRQSRQSEMVSGASEQVQQAAEVKKQDASSECDATIVEPHAVEIVVSTEADPALETI
jgi:MFS family permease